MEKLAALQALFAAMDRALVAYSGGIDSTLVAKVAFDVLGDRALAVTADSPSLMPEDLEDAKVQAAEIGIPHEIVNTHEMDNPNYTSNPANRCYFCKSELHDTLKPLALERGYPYVVDGVNADDLSDYRPGIQAAKERGGAIAPGRSRHLQIGSARNFAIAGSALVGQTLPTLSEFALSLWRVHHGGKAPAGGSLRTLPAATGPAQLASAISRRYRPHRTASRRHPSLRADDRPACPSRRLSRIWIYLRHPRSGRLSQRQTQSRSAASTPHRRLCLGIRI